MTISTEELKELLEKATRALDESSVGFPAGENAKTRLRDLSPTLAAEVIRLKEENANLIALLREANAIVEADIETPGYHERESSIIARDLSARIDAALTADSHDNTKGPGQ